MRVPALMFVPLAAVPAFGQWIAVPPPVYHQAPVPVFLSEAMPVPVFAAAPPVATSASLKPVAPRQKRVLVERHYLGGKAGITPIPAASARKDDDDYDQIVREYYFIDGAKAAEPKAEPAESAPKTDEKPVVEKLPKKIALPTPPANSTAGEGELGEFGDKPPERTPPPPPTAVPAPNAADRKPNGASNYPPKPLEGLGAEPKTGDALAIAAAPVSGLAKSPRGQTPYAEMELRFVHHAGAGKRHAEQSCRTDRKGEFATNLEPGVWTMYLVLSNEEGFEKLAQLKVLAKGPNVFRMTE